MEMSTESSLKTHKHTRGTTTAAVHRILFLYIKTGMEKKKDETELNIILGRDLQ